MEYIKVSKEKGDEIMQDIYKYMPLFTALNGEIVRVVAKIENKIYCVQEVNMVVINGIVASNDDLKELARRLGEIVFIRKNEKIINIITK